MLDKNEKKITYEYIPGVITIGGEAQPQDIDTSGIKVSIDNASANPGDTITLYARFHNLQNTNTELIAINFFLEYDNSIMNVTSIKACGAFSSSGSFIAN